MKQDEKEFFQTLVTRISNHGVEHQRYSSLPMIKAMLRGEDRLSVKSDIPTPRDIINEHNFPIPQKRAWYLLEKWCKKGWYDYGVNLELGWITEEGNKAAIELGLK
jgi:hypothetical protein